MGFISFCKILLKLPDFYILTKAVFEIWGSKLVSLTGLWIK